METAFSMKEINGGSRPDETDITKKLDSAFDGSVAKPEE